MDNTSRVSQSKPTGYVYLQRQRILVKTLTFLSFQFNNTLAPYKTYVLLCASRNLASLIISLPSSCPNAQIHTKSDRGQWYIERWANIYLKDARKRLKKQLHGLDLSIEDVYIMQQMCPYEVLRLLFSLLAFQLNLILRPWHLDTLSSANSLRRKSGKGSIMRMSLRFIPSYIHY